MGIVATSQDHLPKVQLTLLALVQIAGYIAEESTEVYLWHILKSFHTAKTPDQVRVLMNYLDMAVYLPRIASYIFWSITADRIGRKPVLLIGLVGLAIGFIFYGMGRKFWIIVLGRFIGSALDGNDAIIRTCLGELTTSKIGLLIAYGTIPLTLFIGGLIGPEISDNLRTPWNGAPPPGPEAHDFAHTFPFALPNYVLSAILIFTAFIAFLFLKETSPDHKDDRDVGIEFGRRIKSVLRIKDEPSYVSAGPQEEGENFDLDQDDIPVDDPESIADGLDDESRNSRNLIHSAIAHVLLTTHSMIFPAMTELIISATLDKDGTSFPFHFKGGFSISFGVLPMERRTTSIIAFLVAAIMCTWLVKKYDVIPSYRVFLYFFPIVYIFFPSIAYVTPTYAGFPESFALGLVYLAITLFKTASYSALPLIALLINSYCTPQNRSRINGYVLSAYAATSYFGPYIAKKLEQLSNDHTLQPLFWWGLALFAVFGCIQSQALRQF